MVNGLPNRVDRIKALGNAVIPQIVTQLGLEIIAAEREFKNDKKLDFIKTGYRH